MRQTLSPPSLPIRRLTDSQLVEHVDLAVRRERASAIDLLESLAEIDRRSLYLRQGYSSLFDYCTRRWKYAPATAGRYIAAARAAARFPQVRTLLDAGRLTVCAAARLASTLNAENCDELTSRAAGRTFAEVETLVEARRTAPRVPDRIRMIGVSRTTNPASAPLSLALDGESRTQRCEVGTGAATRDERSAEERRGSPGCERPADRCPQQSEDRSAAPDRPADGATNSQYGSARSRPTPERELRYEIRFSARQRFVEKLERAKSICSNKADLESVLERALDELLDRRDPERRSERRARRVAKRRAPGPTPGPIKASTPTSTKRATPTPTPHPAKGATLVSTPTSAKGTAIGPTPQPPLHRRGPNPTPPTEPAPRTRHIPVDVRDQVFRRDGGQCTYVSPSGVRCAARVFLQFDHLVPYRHGGRHTLSNLRLRCGRHNRMREDLGGGSP